MRIVFVGCPACGKSTLAAQVFAKLKTLGKNTELVDEFIRRDIQLHGPMTSIWEQYRTRMHQEELENAVPANVEYTVVDSGTLSPYFYSALYVDATDPRQRLVLSDMFRLLLDDIFLNRYDYIFYLPPRPGVSAEDGTRYQTNAELTILDDHFRMTFMKIFNLTNAHMIDGEFNTRLDKVMNIILPTRNDIANKV